MHSRESEMDIFSSFDPWPADPRILHSPLLSDFFAFCFRDVHNRANRFLAAVSKITARCPPRTAHYLITSIPEAASNGTASTEAKVVLSSDFLQH